MCTHTKSALLLSLTVSRFLPTYCPIGKTLITEKAMFT